MATFTIDPKTIDWDSVEIDGVYFQDYPDFSDAFFAYGCFNDGTQLTDSELDTLREENPDKVWDKAMELYL